MKRVAPVITMFGLMVAAGAVLAQAGPPLSKSQIAAREEYNTYVDLRHVEPVVGDAAAGEASSKLCSTCHSDNGMGIATAFPNLPGLSAEFMYWTMIEYKRGVNLSPMTPIAKKLSDKEIRDLSVYYAGLPTNVPFGEKQQAANAEADPALLEQGRTLYFEGDIAGGVPSCVGCHGSDARGLAGAGTPDRNGHLPYALYPTLRGQQPAYLQTELRQYRDGRLVDSTTDFVMSGAARNLDDEAIEAVSYWLSSLPLTEG